MKSKTNGIIGGILYLLVTIVHIVWFGLLLINNPNGKPLVILLANYDVIISVICGFVIASSMLKDNLGKGILISLIINLIPALIDVYHLFSITFQTMPLITVAEVISITLPTILLIIFYVKAKNNEEFKLFYLPALIFFITNLFPTVASILADFTLITTPSEIVSILGYLLYSFALFFLGAFIKEY